MNDLPANWGIVGFHLPGQGTCWWRGPVVKGATGQGFVIAPFDTSQPVSTLRPEEQDTESPQEWPSLTAAKAGQEDDPAGYRKKVAQVVRQLDHTTLQKVVLSRAKILRSISDPILFFEQLQRAYPDTFTYLLWTPQHGCWAGASPETLLAYREGHWTTQALAGTLPYPSPPEWRDKEYHEQQLVTNSICEALAQAGFTPLVGERETVVAGQVQHLSTSIKVKDVFTIEQAHTLARLLHPTPAVCGWPRQAARQVIAAIEQRDRQLYTGFLGPLVDSGRAQLFVNLRCCQLWKDAVTLHVGGGIVAGSDPEEEWQETEHKAQTLERIIMKMERK